MTSKRRIASVLAAVAGLAFALPSQAQLFRAYLSTKGNDGNACTLPAPCRLLPAAINAVGAGGEIWILDSANYNTSTVDVTKSVSILAIPGVVGSVVALNGPALRINTAGVRLTLRNLTLGPVAGSLSGDGIVALDGAALNLERCVVAGLSGKGLSIDGPLDVAVMDTVIRDNNLGIDVTGAARLALSKVTLAGHASAGMRLIPSAGRNASALVVDSVATENSHGFVVTGGTGHAAQAFITRTVASGNTQAGFAVTSLNAASDALLELSQSVASRNAVGISNTGGLVWSAGNNRASGNTAQDTSGPITVTASK